MGRRRAEELCLVCMELPCACKKAAKKSAPLGSKRSGRKSSEPQARADNTVTAGQNGQTAGLSERSSRAGLIGSTRTIDELIEEDAIRNLGELLCEEDQQRYQGILTGQPTPEERLRVWRHRQEEARSGR